MRGAGHRARTLGRDIRGGVADAGGFVVSVEEVSTLVGEGLSLADVITWTDGETTVKEASRMADVAHRHPRVV